MNGKKNTAIEAGIKCNACGQFFPLKKANARCILVERTNGTKSQVFWACPRCAPGIEARIRGLNNINRVKVWSCVNPNCTEHKGDFWVEKHEGKITSTTLQCKLCGQWTCYIYKDEY